MSFSHAASLLLVLAVVCEVLAYPEVSSITGLSSLRSEEQHPLDLFKPDLRIGATEEENSGFFIHVNSTEIDGGRPEWVTVSWSGVRRPTAQDVVALFAVGDESWKSKAPIKSLYAAESNSHLHEGSGSFKVLLLNHRADVRFEFLRSFFGISRTLGESEVITIRNKDAPLYVHLALTGQSNEMNVQWVSATNSEAFVKWGTVSGKYEGKVRAESTTYTADDLCGPPATTQGFIFPGFMHSATLTDLTPGLKYFYVFGNEEGGYSEEHSFVAPPEVGSSETVKIIGLGDMGQYNIDYFDNPYGREPSIATAANINTEEDVDLVMHVGDISYAQGYVADWDVFFDQMLPLTSRVPYMTVPGNHERLYPNSGDRYDVGRDSGGECGVVYERRLKMPSAGKDKPWYAFDFGPIHFTTFSTEHPFEQGTEQYQFLKKDLEGVDRTVTPWVIVCFHRPMFPGITRDFPPRGYWYVGQELQQQLGELFQQNKVDMLWSGHHHSYQRTCPVHNEKCVELDRETGEALAPVQLIFGNAGASLYHNLVWRNFIEFQALEFGYVRFLVNTTHLIAEAIRNEDKTVMDSVTLNKAVSYALPT